MVDSVKLPAGLEQRLHKQEKLQYLALLAERMGFKLPLTLTKASLRGRPIPAGPNSKPIRIT